MTRVRIVEYFRCSASNRISPVSPDILTLICIKKKKKITTLARRTLLPLVVVILEILHKAEINFFYPFEINGDYIINFAKARNSIEDNRDQRVMRMWICDFSTYFCNVRVIALVFLEFSFYV